MMIAGYILAILVGVSLGLIGGGGSILTVPILVYVMGVDVISATAYSLFIVGSTSFFGALNAHRKKQVDIKTAFIFAPPSIISIYLTRKYLIPAIPDPVITFSSFTLTKDIAILLLFAIVMVFASYSMIRKKPIEEALMINGKRHYNFPKIFLQGIGVGILAGAVGAGGGFLIIPSLIYFSRLPMKTAIGTSLVIIASNSLIGFLGDVFTREIDWQLILIFATLSVSGIFLGGSLNNKFSGEKLKPAFGWFVLLMGCYIIYRELF